MKKYRCKICGYIYDEAVEKVRFQDLPDDWKCPLCGAPKDMFEEVQEEVKEASQEVINEMVENLEEEDDLRELTPYELAFLCSNFAKGCEKQYLFEEQALFEKLADYYRQQDHMMETSMTEVSSLVKEEQEMLQKAMSAAQEQKDRGAQRILTWAGKTSLMIDGILRTYQEKGSTYLENSKIWVCDICGFVYIGDTPPKVCPVCKVPSFKILEVK